MDDFPFLRELRSPVTADQLRPLSPKCRSVQFSDPLTDRDHKKVATFLRKYPDVALRAYGHYSKPCDTDFLRHYPNVRRLAIELYNLVDLNGITRFVSPDLLSLVLGKTKSRSHSLAFLKRFPRLESLYVEGHKKDIDVIGSLSRLNDLMVRSITLSDLTILKPLRRLQSLDIKLGGTTNLNELPEISRLRYLELWMVRGLSDLGPIRDVQTLQYLFLQALKNVAEIPSLSKHRFLRRIHIETMKGLADLRPVADAPALEELVAVDMQHLNPDDFEPFVGHPTLRRASIGLGSVRRNQAVFKLLGLPDVKNSFEFEESTGAS